MRIAWLFSRLLLVFFMLSMAGCFGGTKPNTVDSDSSKQNKTEVETLLSQSIFLRPTAPTERSLYIRFSSTADKPVDLEGMQKELTERFRAKGFKITSPEDANFLLQINLLSISKTSKALTREAVNNGFGAAVAIANVAVGPAGQVVGTAAESATSIFFRDTYFNMITDILITERADRINTLKPDSETLPAKWKEHTTRALSSVKDVNASQDECVDLLEESLLRVLNGLF
ncbi:MAG: complement resistance protein TraT [Proteobacteria bacterium]|nr:complement resistance protein TraT [Pseudomonadota bacterium]